MTSPRSTVRFLALCVGLMMTGFGIIMPVFARRTGELGGGVATLGIMTMSFALAHVLFSPLAGTLSDRIGRRPLVLLGLAGFALSNVAYLIAPTTGWFIASRALAGVLTAGLFPAAMAIVDDISAKNERAARVGLVMAGYGIGFVLGPVLGGVLYDTLGFSAPFILSGLLGLIAFVAASRLVPETLVVDRDHEPTKTDNIGWLPRPLAVIATMLAIDFTITFAFAYIEPQMVFYVYDVLNWSTLQFGVIAGGYGVALALSQVFLSKVSDRRGRKPVILFGLVLSLALYIGMATITGFAAMLLAAFVAGAGVGLVGPALSALYLDVADDAHRGRVMGLKSSASSLGGVLGPLCVALAAGFLSPVEVFTSAGVVIAATVVISSIVLPPARAAEANLRETALAHPA